MPEKEVVDGMKSLQVSQYIYQRNYEELSRFIDFVQHDPSNQDLWHMTTIRKGRAIRLELARLLQNYVASVKSLVDHTRRHVRKMYSDGSFADYQRKVDQVFKNDDLVQFVQALRDILLHTRTAPLRFHGRMGFNGDATNEIGLEAEVLREHGPHLNSAARHYLANADDVVDIPSLIVQYHDKIEEFYFWFGCREQELCSCALRRFADKERLLFLLQIRDHLDAWFANPNPKTNAAAGDRGLFMGLFDIAEFERLEALPAGSSERLEAALAMLRSRFRIPDNLERDIRRAYADPDFFEWRMPDVEA